MTTLREAAQQALEAWEQINLYGFVLADYEGPMEQAITALKAALEKPARPLCKGIPRRGCNYLAPCDTVCNKCGEIHHHHQMVAHFEAAQQPEQEPVAWGCFRNGELQTELVGTEADVDFWCASDEPEMQGMVKGALFTHLPRRECLHAFARCAGNPERTECGTCSRRADPRSPLRRTEWWIGPWVGHGSCPDRRATPESATPQ